MNLHDKIKLFDDMVSELKVEKQAKAHRSLTGDTSCIERTLNTAKKFDIKLAQNASQEMGPTMEGGFSGSAPTSKPKLPSAPKDVQLALQKLTGIKSWYGQEPDGVRGDLVNRALNLFKSKYPQGSFTSDEQLFSTIRERAGMSGSQPQSLSHTNTLVDKGVREMNAPQGTGSTPQEFKPTE